MNDRPIALKLTDRLQDAAEIILTHHFRNVPVVDEHGRCLGVISSNRLLASIQPKAATLDAGVADLSFVKDTVEELAGRRPSDDREGNRLGAGVHRLCIAAVDRIAG
jgi:CBS domain-containing protein